MPAAPQQAPIYVQRIELYLTQIETYCVHALNAIHTFSQMERQNFNDVVNGRRPAIPAQAEFQALDAFIHNCAMLYKMLWPIKKNKPYQIARCERLRRILGVDDNSLINSKSLRNAIEHFDEKLDDWIQNQTCNGHIVEACIGDNVFSEYGVKKESFFSAYSRATKIYVFMGEEYRLEPMVRDVEHIFEKVQKSLAERDPRRSL